MVGGHLRQRFPPAPLVLEPQEGEFSAIGREDLVVKRLADDSRKPEAPAVRRPRTLAMQQQNDEMRRLSEAGLAQNEEVKKISSWAAILFAPTLVGTIYGMNFDSMPELHWEFGYPVAVAAMGVMGLGLWGIFKRRKWL